MAQHDYSLEDEGGLAFLANLNEAMKAIVSNNSGSTEPSPAYAFQWWADTTTGILKQRNAANNEWIEILDLETGRPVGAVAQTSPTGALLLAEGTDTQRPAPEDIPSGVAAVRGNSTSPLDYFLELWDRPAAAWRALADRVWVRKNTLVQGQYKNLRCSAAGTNALVSVAADQLVLENADGEAIKLRGVDLTINTATVGVNGLDTGALVANTWYSLWVISDGINMRGLISLSATAPTLPSGYTSKARVGWIRTDSTASKYPSAFVQRGKYIDWVTPVVVGSGVMGVWSPVAWAEISLSTAIPVTSISVKGFINGGLASIGQGVQAAPNNSFTATQTSTNPAPVDTSSGSGEAIGRGSRMFNFVLQSSSIYGCSNAAAASIRVLGWEDSL